MSLTNEQRAAIRKAAISMGKDPDIIERAVEREFVTPYKASEVFEIFEVKCYQNHFQQKKRPLTEERKQWKKKLHKLMKA